VIEAEKVKLNTEQKRNAQEFYSKAPKLRYWDEIHNRFIEMKSDGSRDLIFTDPDEGFSFDDPDADGAMMFTDDSGNYIVFSSGFGVSGQGGGGMVVAGNTILNMAIVQCISASAVQNGEGDADLFSTGFGFSEFSVVIGIAGDFEALADADQSAEDFDPFEYIYGFAIYYVLSDDASGSHEVFDFLDSDGTENFDDFATAMVIDLQNFALGFASGGVITVSGGTMSFNGTYLMIDGEDIFNAWLGDDEDPELNVSEVSGYGSMGCN
jgi:hypothetical protein